MRTQLSAAEWNKRYPVGTAVIAYPGVRPEYAAEVGLTDNPVLETRTRSVAWNLGHGEPVVMVDGYAGGISLDHIDLREDVPQPCPGVGEYGHGLTARTVHWGCCSPERGA